jgi:hypothetical protein
MNLFTELLKKSYDKVEQTEESWCGTPSGPGVHRDLAKSLKIGKGSYDFLLGPIEQAPSNDSKKSNRKPF